MTATALYEALTERGVRLRVKGDALCTDAPPGVLTPQILRAIATAKPRLVAIINRQNMAQSGVRSTERTRAQKAYFESEEWGLVVDIFWKIKPRLTGYELGPWVPEETLLSQMEDEGYDRAQIKDELKRWQKNGIFDCHRPQKGTVLWRYLPPGLKYDENGEPYGLPEQIIPAPKKVTPHSDRHFS